MSLDFSFTPHKKLLETTKATTIRVAAMSNVQKTSEIQPIMVVNWQNGSQLKTRYELQN